MSALPKFTAQDTRVVSAFTHRSLTHTGCVKNLFPEERFGLITIDANQTLRGDIRFNYSTLKRSGIDGIAKGQRVKFIASVNPNDSRYKVDSIELLDPILTVRAPAATAAPTQRFLVEGPFQTIVETIEARSARVNLRYVSDPQSPSIILDCRTMARAGYTTRDFRIDMLLQVLSIVATPAGFSVFELEPKPVEPGLKTGGAQEKPREGFRARL